MGVCFSPDASAAIANANAHTVNVAPATPMGPTKVQPYVEAKAKVPDSAATTSATGTATATTTATTAVELTRMAVRKGTVVPHVSPMDNTGKAGMIEWHVKGLSRHLHVGAECRDTSLHLTSPEFMAGEHAFVVKLYPFEALSECGGGRSLGVYVVSNDYESPAVRVSGALTIAHPSDSKQDYVFAFGPVRIDYHNAWGFPNAISRESALKRTFASADHDTLVLRVYLHILLQHRRSSLIMSGILPEL